MQASNDWPAEKLEALAEFAAGAGHEINNPVATICGRVEQLLADERDPERRRLLATIGGQALRIRDMIGDCMRFARPPVPSPSSIALAPVVESVLAPLRRDAERRGIHWTIAIPPDAALFADENQLAVALGAVVKNGIDAVDDGGRIEIAVERRDDDLRIAVSDDGVGLSEIDRQHLFDPFYSGRQAGRGLGFGLCHCYRIVQMHGGRIEVEAPPEGGCRVEMHWPANGPKCETP